MAENKLLKRESLDKLFEKIRESGKRIVAPRERKGLILFEEVSKPDEMAKDYIQTTLSAKSFVFPKCEELFSYKFDGNSIMIEDKKFDLKETVIFGLRPCDARSFSALDAVFNWDYKDVFYNARKDKLTFITISCDRRDEFCFCTSVGGGPGDTKGSDIVLTKLGSGDYLAEIITDKGKKITEIAEGLFETSAGEKKEQFLADVPVEFDLKKLQMRLKEIFNNNELWVEQSLRCVGCGVCAFVCPACYCFDIQDEANREGGKRLRCWDSCAFSLFTLHTSGHNPRPVQSQRRRQRVMHKFSYIQERLGAIGCYGCGRCSRLCPASMDLIEDLKAIAEAL